MGLFDQLAKGIGKAVGEKVGEVINDNITDKIAGKINEALDTLTENLPENVNKESSRVENTVRPQTQAVKPEELPEDYGVSERPLYAQIERTLREEFPQLVIRKNVSPAEFGGRKSYRPYSFVVYEAEKPIGFIMVIPHNRDNNNAFRGAVQISSKAGFPLIRFYEQFENKQDYVVNRLHERLNR